MSRATKLKQDIVKLQMEVSKLKHDNATLRRQLNTALDLAYEANNLALSSARPVPPQTRESSRNPIFDEQGIESVIPLFAGTGVRLSTIDDTISLLREIPFKFSKDLDAWEKHRTFGCRLRCVDLLSPAKEDKNNE